MNVELSPLPRGGGGHTLVMAYTGIQGGEHTLVMAYTGIQGGSAQMGYLSQASGTDCV